MKGGELFAVQTETGDQLLPIVDFYHYLGIRIPSKQAKAFVFPIQVLYRDQGGPKYEKYNL